MDVDEQDPDLLLRRDAEPLHVHHLRLANPAVDDPRELDRIGPRRPASNVGLAIGISSTLVESTPVFGVSGYGSPTDILMPTRTSVFPSFTRALPSAVLTKARSTLTFRG